MPIDSKLPVIMAINYGSNKVRFINPVKVNSKVRASSKLIKVTPKPDKQGLLLTSEVTVEIEGEEKPALVSESLFMLILNLS